MAENKTKPQKASVSKFLNGIADPAKREDCKKIAALMEKITKEKPVMWGNAIIGFGNYHYKYASGREGDFFLTGFSPRSSNITIYIIPSISNYPEQAKKLGKFKAGSSCLYIKTLADLDLKILTEIIKTSVSHMKKQYPSK